MKTYTVEVEESTTYRVVVKAKSQKQAKEKAERMVIEGDWPDEADCYEELISEVVAKG